MQAERDTATAIRRARASNDFLAREVQSARPLFRFAHLPMQDAKAAADELERCVRDMKFCGAMIDSHTNGKYLDDRSYDPFWERAAGLSAPIYLHPADPVEPLAAIAATTCWRGRCGAGAWRPARMRCASSAAACSIAIRRRSSCSAISARRCRSSSGVSTAARRPMAGIAEAAVAIPSGERLGDDLGHVRSSAAALLARCTGARPRHVLGRLSFDWPGCEFIDTVPLDEGHARTSPITMRRSCWGCDPPCAACPRISMRAAWLCVPKRDGWHHWAWRDRRLLGVILRGDVMRTLIERTDGAIAESLRSL